jgi:hypothetical protein
MANPELPVRRAVQRHVARQYLEEVGMYAGLVPAITLGGRPEGPLPSPDEVQVRRKLGRIMLILPHGFDDWAAQNGTVIVERVPEGLLIKVVGHPSSEARGLIERLGHEGATWALEPAA